MYVNSSVIVTDEKSEHHGRAGVISAIKKGGVLVVMLDADSEREHLEVEFRQAQVKAL